MKFDTKIAVVLREDLATWQKLNVTAFTISGIAGTVEGIVGENYEDASGNVYLPMIIQPIMIFAADAAQMRTVYERAMAQEARFAIYTEELFSTGHDEANRAAVKAVAAEDLNLVGIALRADKKAVDKILKGLSLHK
ncbi:MAG: DUF2000 family protein [Chloroflexi bacterium]|nr:DUF2000 family protein [Chloroflexota bacterium]OJV96556.1 MAG: hypothetical protein BGO39_09875 [Chloroflexi bacterium 54-19]